MSAKRRAVVDGMVTGGLVVALLLGVVGGLAALTRPPPEVYPTRTIIIPSKVIPAPSYDWPDELRVATWVPREV